MRPLHLETEMIEKYLFGQTTQIADFELRMMLDDSLWERVASQKNAYKLIRAYGRRELRTELEQIHEELARTHYAWFEQIKSLFTGKSCV